MHPYLHILGRELPSYGVFCALGILTALALALWRVKRAGLRLDAAFVLFTLSLGAALIGALLAYGFVTYGFRGCFLMLIGEREMGLVFYGGILAGVPAAWLLLRLMKMPFLPYANALAPAIPLGHAWGRVGCFLAGCCYGRETSLPLKVQYPAGHITHGAGVLPVQLFECACLLALCLFLLADSRRHPRRTMRLYLAVYAGLRFFLEFLRGDAARGLFLGLSTAQWISVLLLFCLSVFRKKRAKA